MSKKGDPIDLDIPSIELVDVVAGYGEKVILNGINMAVTHGEIFTVIGLSGSGKSTLLKLIIGFLKPKSGMIMINGKDITRMSEQRLTEVRKGMGMVFQHAALFDSLNVFENVAFPLRYRKEKTGREIREIVREKLDDVEMEGTENLMPDELSGGMQKRVGLARALAENPRIILYDEPMTGLDPVIKNNINKLILRTRDRYDASSLIISHDMEAMFATSDRVGVLANRKIVFIGTPDELRNCQLPDVQAFIKGEAAPPHLNQHAGERA